MTSPWSQAIAKQVDRKKSHHFLGCNCWELSYITQIHKLMPFTPVLHNMISFGNRPTK